MVGERALFQVKMTGFPRPKLVWYHNGEKMVPDYSREIMKDRSLTMPSVEVRQTGTYKAFAENEVGKKEGAVQLYVEDDEGMTKPKQGKGKPLLKTKDIPVAMFGRHVKQNHTNNNMSQFWCELTLNFYCSMFPLFRTCTMELPGQLPSQLLLRTS